MSDQSLETLIQSLETLVKELKAENVQMREAIEQALDDMGIDYCVCQETKELLQQAIIEKE